MAQAMNEDITIEYDSFGSPSDPAILLVMGLGAQMVAWRPEFCELLVDAGFRVIRFDNRDSGLSTKTPGKAPNFLTVAPKTLIRRITGRGKPVPYRLTDMARDAVAVLDAEGIESAHVVGASMGGMIAQTIAIHHSARVKTLTSIMSTTGSPLVGRASLPLARQLMEAAPKEAADAIDWGMDRFRSIAGPLFDPEGMQEFLAFSYARNYHPEGVGFQLAAIVASGDRTSDLKKLDVPTLVIHGRRDRLVSHSGGDATASAIPGSKLLVFEQMAHDLPQPLWPDITAAIIDLASTNERSTKAAV